MVIDDCYNVNFLKLSLVVHCFKGERPNTYSLEPILRIFIYEILICGIIYPSNHSDIIWFHVIGFKHSCILNLSKCCFKWLEIRGIKWL
jgi:hypothetical protein